MRAMFIPWFRINPFRRFPLISQILIKYQYFCLRVSHEVPSYFLLSEESVYKSPSLSHAEHEMINLYVVFIFILSFKCIYAYLICLLHSFMFMTIISLVSYRKYCTQKRNELSFHARRRLTVKFVMHDQFQLKRFF